MPDGIKKETTSKLIDGLVNARGAPGAEKTVCHGSNSGLSPAIDKTY